VSRADDQGPPDEAGGQQKWGLCTGAAGLFPRLHCQRRQYAGLTIPALRCTKLLGMAEGRPDFQAPFRRRRQRLFADQRSIGNSCREPACSRFFYGELTGPTAFCGHRIRRYPTWHITPFDQEEPFAAIIRCTADPSKVDKRTRSKWSRALRYALAYKLTSEPLEGFMKRKGGINECAARCARH
jgi:hypothetical protein